MSRLASQSSVDESIAMHLQYELSELTINDDVIALEIQQQYQNKLICNDAALALEIQQEEEAFVYSCSHDDEGLARSLQDMEGNLQTSLSDDEDLARYLQQENESVDDPDEGIQFIPMQVNRSYIPQRDAPSTSRALCYYEDGDNFLDHHTHTRISPNISIDSFQSPSIDEIIDPTNMTYEELNELEDSIGDVSKGLSEKKISKLPTHKYGSKPRNWWWQKKKKFFANDSQCSICLVEYANGDKIITLPCNHIYHKDCISHWLKQNRVCCVCKAQV